MFKHTNFGKLEDLVRSTFDIDEDKQIFMHYTDDEEEFVRLTNRAELIECISNSKLRNVPTLRVEVSLERELVNEPTTPVDDSTTESESESDGSEKQNIRKQLHKSFKRVSKTVLQGVKFLEKEAKKAKKSKFRAKMKQGLKKMKENFKNSWKEVKSNVQQWRECKRGWRRHQWEKFMWKKWCHASKPGCGENSNETAEEPTKIEAVSFRSLSSGKNIGPNKKGLDARRGGGSRGKFVLIPGATVFSDLERQDGEVFLIKSIHLGSFLQVKEEENKRVFDCNGDGKSKSCLFKLVPCTDCDNVRKDGLIIELVHVMTNTKATCSPDGNFLQPDDVKNANENSENTLLELIHTTHVEKKKRVDNRQQKDIKGQRMHCGPSNWREHSLHHGRHGPHHGRHGPHHGRHGPHHGRHGPHHGGQGPHHGGPHHHPWRHVPHGKHMPQHGRCDQPSNTTHHLGMDVVNSVWQENMERKFGGKGCPRVDIIKIDVEEDNVTPGQVVTKTWTFRNTSSRTWSKKYSLVHLRGPNLQMDGQESISLPRDVPPGEIVCVSLNMIAPDIIGRYITYWRLVDEAGRHFGPRVWASLTVEK